MPVISPAIDDAQDIPSGQYLCFGSGRADIPESFAESFAVLKTGAGTALVLTAVDANSTHSMFEIGRRLRVLGFARLEFQLASREIIRAVHERHENREALTERETATRFERAGWQMIAAAVARGASDIHIETRTDHAQVFFRIHGERILQPSISRETALGICSTLYTVHGDGNNKETVWSLGKPQDTVIHQTTPDGKGVQIRFHTAPIHPDGNCHCVMRILVMEGQASQPVEHVGYTPAQCHVIEDMLVGATGLVLLVGPTNSGKSTSIQAFIRRIYERRGPLIKLVTVEDPVEYLVAPACQMAVPRGRKDLQDAGGSIYNTLLMATLREDPDVVMVGEVRGPESATAVKDLVLAGRKILSTLHAYEAFATYARLREMGVPQSLLLMRGFISGIIYQRLVPTVCPQCAIPFEQAYAQGLVQEGTYRRLRQVVRPDRDPVVVRNEQGCERCAFTGIAGRTPCAEILVPDEAFLAHMRAGDEAAARAHWLADTRLDVDGLGVSAMAHAISKMRRGLVDPRDVEVQIGLLPAGAAAMCLEG